MSYEIVSCCAIFQMKNLKWTERSHHCAFFRPRTLSLESIVKEDSISRWTLFNDTQAPSGILYLVMSGVISSDQSVTSLLNLDVLELKMSALMYRFFNIFKDLSTLNYRLLCTRFMDKQIYVYEIGFICTYWNCVIWIVFGQEFHVQTMSLV